MLRLSRQNKDFLKVIINGFLKIYLKKTFYSNFLPKKSHGFSKYTIVSAVYNVEKYLDDYFKSIIHQRLDFKNNIFLILVDDGSTDNSANIIKKYQMKYPKNIVYLYKENGGQASARNLGLKYIKENNYQTPWVSFTDPDDFLDRDYFYEVDKFLKENRHEDVCMVGCNIIFYFEKNKSFRDNHPLNFKFQQDRELIINQELNNFIQLSAASCFLNLSHLKNLLFDENLKPNFEDAKFINEYLLENLNSKSAFLKKAIYFYRKREDESSTLNTKLQNKSYYLIVPKLGYLNLLQNIKGKIPCFIQNLVLYDVYWYMRELVNSDKNLFILTQKEKDEFRNLLFEIFGFIDTDAIKNFNNKAFDFYIIQGILSYFKNEDFQDKRVFIEDIDEKNDEVLLKYYFKDLNTKENIFLNSKEISVKNSKIRQYNFMDDVFLYEKRFWIKLDQNSKKLEVSIDSKQAFLEFEKKKINDLKPIYKKLTKQKKLRDKNKNLWLFADMSTRADDNAEHLYRYIMQNYPKQNIIFVLRNDSVDWQRLKKEGFNLVDPRSLKFRYLLHKSSKVISSHIDKYIFNAFGGDTLKNKDFVFLQHGVIKDDLSGWLNLRKIDLFITSTKNEYESIVGDFNHYKFSPKEVILTGLARHDTLLKNNKKSSRQILIMPTWREYLSGKMNKYDVRSKNTNFKNSNYFKVWYEFFHSKDLKDLALKYNYKIIFNPHPQIKIYLDDFDLPSYIDTSKESIQSLFCNSSLMITDYSSVAFEMAYLEKPVIYYQFDKKEFFSNHSYKKGYFDYETDGFGPVIEIQDDLFKELENLLKNDCKIGEPYKSNIKNAFVFKDGKCCERIYEKLIKDEKFI